MNSKRPTKYQKHVQKVKYLEWNRDDGTTRIYEFDSKYKVKKIIDYDAPESFLEDNRVPFFCSEPDLSESQDEEIHVEIRTQPPPTPRHELVIPIIDNHEHSYKRKIIDFPTGLSLIWSNNNPNIPKLLTA